MFDPEKVGRWREQTELMPDSGEEVVSASDYDQLLELYREFVPAVPCYICGNEAKGSKAHVVGSKEAVCMGCWKAA
jgi:hypothetical protein